MKDLILLQLMKLMPTHTISRLVGGLARNPMSKRLIPLFSNHFQIPVEEAEKAIHEYHTLNEFFTRKLKGHLRQIDMDKNTIVSPCDGRVAALGEITKGMLVQAKGVTYTVWDLLGISEQEASSFIGGHFITIYLSPQDYHRIHSPVDGQITHYSYLPGTLFPVNAFGVRAVKGLFAKNERLITFIESPGGRVGVVKVGATIVGSVKVGYSKEAGTNVRAGVVEHQHLPQPVKIVRGGEVGYFEFGSTVVLVFERGKMEFVSELKEGQKVLMGQTIGRLL